MGLALGGFVAGLVLADPCLLAGAHHEYLATLQTYSRPQWLARARHALPTLFLQEQWTCDLLPSHAFFSWAWQKLPFAILSTSLLCGLLPVRPRAALVASLL